MLATKRLEDRRRIHIHRRHHGLVGRDHTSQGFPTLIDLLNGGHIGHGTTRSHIGQNHGLLGAAENIRCLGHEMHATKHNVGPLRTFSRELGQQQRVSTKVGMLNDFITLVVMAEDHHALAKHLLREYCPAKQLLCRQCLILGNGSW